MKRTLTILVALVACLMLVSPVMANGPGPQTDGNSNSAHVDGGTYLDWGNGADYHRGAYAGGTYHSDNSYQASIDGEGFTKVRGFSHAEGDLTYKKKNLKHGSVTKSKSEVSSDAAAWSPRRRNGTGSAVVRIQGDVYQDTGNIAMDGDVRLKKSGKIKFGDDPYAAAWGNESSEALYSSVARTGEQTPYFGVALEGDALAKGKTKTTANVYNGGKTSEAFGKVAANSNAQWNSFRPDCHTTASGSGSINHATFAATKNFAAQAWTNGNASFSYDTRGYDHSSGSGYAITKGYSNVTRDGNHMTAESYSTSRSNSSTSGGQPD